MSEDDPIQDESREHGHLYLLAQPEAAGSDALVEFLSGSTAVRDIRQVIADVLQDTGSAYDPSLRSLFDQIRRADGLAFTSYGADGLPPEYGLLDLLIREDGGIRLICGKGTDVTPAVNRSVVVVWPVVLLGLAEATAAVAGRLAVQHAAHQGEWRVGLRMDRLRGVVPADLVVRTPFDRSGNAYTRDDYERVTSASTEELVAAPHAVAERLVAPLLRGLGVAARYLPYKP